MEEQRDNRENEQAIVVSSIKEREERLRNLSPIWNLPLDEVLDSKEMAKKSWNY